MRSALPPELRERLAASLACPKCRTALVARGEELACPSCSASYPRQGETDVLLPGATRDAVLAEVERWGREAIRPRISYRWLHRLMSPQVHRWGPELRWTRDRIAALPEGCLVLDIGCGASEPGDRVVRLDLSPGPDVDIAGDAHDLPLLDGSVDAILLLRVLEHVKDPVRVVSEALRVLRPGGMFIAVVPFLEPYHRNPTDHSRFCRDGVERLFAGFETDELSVATGPAVTLAWLLKEFAAIVFPFSNRPLVYASVREAVGWLSAPIAWLDPLVRRRAFAHKIAGSFWYVGRRPPAARGTPP